MSAYVVDVNGSRYTVQVKERRGTVLTLEINGQVHSVTVEPTSLRSQSGIAISPIALKSAGGSQSRASATASILELKAPLPGIVSDVKVSPGDKVTSGTTLLVIDAMKMENPIKAPRDVTIKSVEVSKGQEVAHGVLLISFEAP